MRSNTDNSRQVSVIIPCYNQAHFLHEAIESVLKQTYPHFEIIVIDDGSPDNASEVAALYPEVHYIRQQNQGLPGARNAGFYASKGQYLVFLDSDDHLLPNALEVGVENLNSHPECGYVAGQFNHIALDGSPLPVLLKVCTAKPEDHYLRLLNFDETWTPLAVMFRRSAFELVGGYRSSPQIKGCEDYDICLRIASRFPAYCYNQLIAEYRLYETSMSGDWAMMWKSVLNVLKFQRKFIKGNKRLEEAYNTGIQRIQECYSEEVAEQISSRVRSRREYKKIVKGVKTLARLHPRKFLSRCYRLCRMVVAKR